MLDLALLNQGLHRARHVLDRHVRVNAVLVEEVEGLDPEPLQRTLGDLPDVLWSTIQTRLLSLGAELETEFGGDDHFAFEWGEGFAHEFFVREWAVRFSRIEERDAALNGRPKKRDHLLLVCRRTVAKAHSHTAEPASRDFQTALSKFALFHSRILSLISRFLRWPQVWLGLSTINSQPSTSPILLITPI